MGGYSRAEKRNAESAAKATAELPLMPADAVQDEDGRLVTPDGSFVKDGLYRTADGGVIMYEGNFESGNAFIG